MTCYDKITKTLLKINLVLDVVFVVAGFALAAGVFYGVVPFSRETESILWFLAATLKLSIITGGRKRFLA